MSETFDVAWLGLREPVDHCSRARELLAPLREWWVEAEPTHVLDLGAGTGSNLRYLAAELPGPQEWTLVDHDAGLLSRVVSPSPRVAVRPVFGDLAVAGLPEVRGADLVTASALLDLVSESWLLALVETCVQSGCGALFALSYDGTVEWHSAEDPADALVREAVNEHQRRDKGLGPALGPAAGRTADEVFRARGYRTWLAPSPWELGPEDGDLARALIDGWARAAAEQRPDREEDVLRWARRRRATVEEDDFSLTVGHVDLLALPVQRA